MRERGASAPEEKKAGMLTGLLGRKMGMTQVFTEDGEVIPVTVLEVGPCTVLQVKTSASDGYDAVQLGFEDKRRKLAKKPEVGHVKKAEAEPKRFVREIRTDAPEEFALGQTVKVDVFDGVDAVDITGVSKGKGFQGTIRRYHFHRGPASHGSENVRAPGSIGSSADPSRVLPGTKLPGHMGHQRKTEQNLAVVRVDPEKDLLVVKGAVPGPKGGYLIIRKSRKAGAKPA